MKEKTKSNWKVIIYYFVIEWISSITVLIAWTLCLQVQINNWWILFILYPVSQLLRALLADKKSEIHVKPKLKEIAEESFGYGLADDTKGFEKFIQNL